MIRPGFLDSRLRRDLIELARDGSAAHRLARRANALVLLDKCMSCQSVAEVLLLDNGTIRTWYQLYQEDGIEGLASFGHEGDVPRNWHIYCDEVTDNFRVIDPIKYRIIV